jgi:hypothetical protein
MQFHVYKGRKTRDSVGGAQRYATDPNATGEIGTGNFTAAQATALGEYSRKALMRYKDPNAYFCHACRRAFGVECPKCGTKSPKRHDMSGLGTEEDMFRVTRDGEGLDRYQWAIWTKITCRKCDFEFRVMMQ